MAVAGPPRPPVRTPPAAPVPVPAPAAGPAGPATAAATAGARVAVGLRAVAFAGLSLLGLLVWARQLAPTASGVALQCTLTACGCGAVLAVVRARPLGPRALRTALLVVLAALAVVATGLAAGVPLRLLAPHRWGELTSGIGQGLSAVPDLSTPYRGLDDWVRIVVMDGGGLLAVAAAGLTWWPAAAPDPRRSHVVGAAVVLAVLYGVGVVERDPPHQFASGALLALGLALFLGADRLAAVRTGSERAGVVALTAATVGLGLLIAPGLDARRPWLDYRHFADPLAAKTQTTFSWDHTYGPLHWPRDGHELLRVKARTPAYWKAVTLDDFDGRDWTTPPADQASPHDDFVPTNRPNDIEQISVTVRGLKSQEIIGAGTTLAVHDTPQGADAAGGGTFTAAGRPLKAGDTYTADVYAPQPDPGTLRAAGTDYPTSVLGRDLSMALPASAGGPRRPSGRDPVTVQFQPFADPGDPLVEGAGALPYRDGSALLAHSGYARTWALAQRLRREARTPAQLVDLVERRVDQDATYTELPSVPRIPLDGFLFDTHEGYCQQFSGAMALLLRMAGVPARVGSGFTSGAFDPDRGEYVVRDLDAHSWVEAFFPGIGWVTFDPTPAEAPPRNQIVADTATQSAAAQKPKLPPVVPKVSAKPGAAGSAGGGGGSGWLVVAGVGGALVLAGVAAGGLLLARRAALDPFEELALALRRSGRTPAGGLTLRGLERSFHGAPEAEGYVRALREARYAGTGGRPTEAQRRGLRRELGSGLGWRGRLAAWWALPPRRVRSSGPGRRLVDRRRRPA